MALNFDGNYTPRSTPADANYPYGSFKNDGVPGDLSGTPGDKDWANDFLGFFQKLLNYAGIIPSGVPDTIVASDFFDALVKRINALSQYLVDSGAADAYVVGGDPAYTAYTAGMKIRVKIANTNTGASTINVDSLGAKSIVKYVGTALVAGDLPAGAIAEMQYDGTNFQLQHVHNINPTLTSLILTGAAANPPVANALVKDNIVKGWINFDGTGTISITDSFNVSSIVDNGTGDYTINWDTDFADINYVTIWNCVGDASNAARIINIQDAGKAVGSISVVVNDTGNAKQDEQEITGMAIGDQ